MHEARAALLAVQLGEANARIAQLEDELTVSRDDALEIATNAKPDVKIDTGDKLTNNGPGTIKTKDPAGDAALGTGLAILSAVLGVVGLIAVFWRRKGK
ncbi:MAG: hypothetical protein RL514_3501 [Verrucomicrobiota bacterium]|jgi:hypothetical protein